MYQPVTARPARPAVVTIAAIMMWLMALLSLFSAAVGFIALSGAADSFHDLATREDLRADEIDAGVTAIRAGFICSGVLLVLLALLLAGLAFGLMRASNVARIATWVVCGLGAFCACCTGFGSLASLAGTTGASTDPDQMIANLVVQALPDWAGGVLAGSSALSVLGYIATAVLLALPPANAFFRSSLPPPPPNV